MGASELWLSGLQNGAYMGGEGIQRLKKVFLRGFLVKQNPRISKVFSVVFLFENKGGAGRFHFHLQ